MPDDATLIEFLDDDLREELDKYKHGPGSSVMRELILAKQRKRQVRNAMTPVQRRRDMAREALQADVLKDADRYHIHSVLAMCGLPYRRPDDGALRIYPALWPQQPRRNRGTPAEPRKRADGEAGPALRAEGRAS